MVAARWIAGFMLDWAIAMVDYSQVKIVNFKINLWEFADWGLTSDAWFHQIEFLPQCVGGSLEAVEEE